MAKVEFQALTREQVNSWPIETPNTLSSGDSLSSHYGSDSKEAFLLLAQERFKVCVDATIRQRRESQEDVRFFAGIQWEQDIANRRAAQQRPCLTINRIPEFVAHSVNNMRQQRPEIKVIPTTEGADENLAEVEEGLLRHIQTNSDADTSYDESFKDMCIGGLGWMRVVDDWASPESLDKELFIRPVANPFTVYCDPFCAQLDWSDMRYAFVVEDLTRAEFKKRYPESEISSLNNFQSLGDTIKYWFPGDNIRVAEYFHVEMKNDYVCELEDGSTRLLSKLPKGMYSVHKGTDGEYGCYLNDQDDVLVMGEYIGRARKTKIPQVYWAKITAIDVLQERSWKGRYVPLIPVIGDRVELDGERVLVGMVRYAREPQRMYNYMYTCFVETVALMPRAPWVALVNQIPDGGVRDMWQNQNTDPQQVLLYKWYVDEHGNPAPPPQRQIAGPDIGAFVQGLQMSDQNLKSVFRIYDASLGQKGPQESGLAINARKVESDTGIYNWADNFIRSLRYLGTVLEDLLPSYYNSEGRIFQLIQQDGSTKSVTMNAPTMDQGRPRHYDLEKGGNYRIVISTGPNYATKRKEAAQSMIDFFQIYPAGLQACAHILVGEMDFPGKDKIKAQLEKILPPALQTSDQNEQIPPQLQTQMAQMTQTIQQLTGALHEALDKKAIEQLKQDAETFRTQMTQERQLASDAMKAGAAQAEFLAQKSFEELNYQRGLLERLLAAQESGGNATAPGGSAPSQPNLAVPPTGGVNPSVGGV